VRESFETLKNASHFRIAEGYNWKLNPKTSPEPSVESSSQEEVDEFEMKDESDQTKASSKPISKNLRNEYSQNIEDIIFEMLNDDKIYI